MTKIKLSVKKHGQFIRFCIVGLMNTGISLIVYALLLKINVHYLTASTMSYIAGIINGYIFSSSFVFKRKFNFSQGLKFLLVYISSLLINLAMLFILVDIFNISEILGQVLVTFFNIFYNFLLNKFWTFKR